MKQTIKRIIVAILGVALLISTVAFTSSCKKSEDKKPPVQPPYSDDSKVVIGNLIYQLVDDDYDDNGTPAYYTVIGISNSDANRVVIPAEADGTPVKAIAADAFYGNVNLESVEIPSTVTKVGERAFAACASLSSIEVAADNEELKSVDGSLYTKDGSVLLQYAIGKGDSSFAVPAGVTEIAAYAFAGSNFDSLTLPQGLVTIGDFAFASNKFKSIEIPASVESVSGSAFDFCSSLAAINVNAANAVYKSVSGSLYTKSNSTLVRYAIAKSDKSFSVASGTLVIGDYAFSGATLLESISLPSSLTTIGEFAFLGCESLKSLAITGSVSSIAPSAFDNCYALASFTVNAQNKSFSVVSGVLMTDSSKTIVKYPPAKSGTKYDLLNTVTAIGPFAFADAVNLKKLNLNTKLEYIGVDAFDGCKLLEFNKSSGVNYLGTTSNQYYALVSLSASSDNMKSLETRSNTALIAGGAFKGNNVIDKITLSPSVKYVCDDAFAYCTALEKLDFKSVVKIYGGALSHCPSLTDIVFGNSVKLIEDNAVFDCPAIQRVFYNVASSEEWEELKVNSSNPLVEGKQNSPSFNSATRYYYSATEPTSVGNYWRYASGQLVIWTTVGEIIESKGLEFTLNASGSHYIVSGIGEFNGTDLVIPAKYNKKPVKEIGGGAFVGNNKIISVVLPYSIESVGANAFTDCLALSSVSLSDSVTFIGAGAFKNCHRLSTIDIPDGVSFIEPETFAGCTSLRNLTLPDNLIAIRASAFYDCAMLNSILLPYGTLSIGDSAFYGCTNILGTLLPETLTEIGNNAFTSSGLKSIEIPASVLWISDSAFRGCASLEKIEVNENNTEYSSTNGVLYRKVNDVPVTLICCPSGYIYPKKTPNDKSAQVTLTIPDTVKTIVPYAVLSENLRFIELGESTSLEVIGDYAFAGSTGLANVYLPSTIKSIGKYAFEGSGASILTIKDGASFTIGEGAFKNCISLNTVTLPEGTLSIARHAFYGCSALMEIVIPDSVTDIGILAFACSGKLKTVALGNGITTLAGSVFAECVALEEVTIGAAVSEIADTAFSGCKALRKIIVDSSNATYKTIDDVLYTADGKTLVLFPASKAERFEIPDGVTTIGDLAFSGSSIVSVVIPDSVTVIGDSAFSLCRLLETITIGEKLECIGASAFADCEALTSVDFVDSTTSLTVGDLAFSGCESLKELVLPDRITELGIGAFKNCRHIVSVKIGNGLTEIKKDTFSGDDNIEWIVLGAGVTVIGENAFKDCTDLTSLYCVGDSDSYAVIKIASGNIAITSASRYHYSATDPNSWLVYWHYASDGSIVFW